MHNSFLHQKARQISTPDVLFIPRKDTNVFGIGKLNSSDKPREAQTQVTRTRLVISQAREEAGKNDVISRSAAEWILGKKGRA